jgi:hypothetical protein
MRSRVAARLALAELGRIEVASLVQEATKASASLSAQSC